MIRIFKNRNKNKTELKEFFEEYWIYVTDIYLSFLTFFISSRAIIRRWTSLVPS
jgi:hypothetical protein